jgi:hypothetical protein
MEPTDPLPTDHTAEATASHRARFQSLNRDRPTDFMGGSQISFRERPPAPIKINSSMSVKDSPFLKNK